MKLFSQIFENILKKSRVTPRAELATRPRPLAPEFDEHLENFIEEAESSWSDTSLLLKSCRYFRTTPDDHSTPTIPVLVLAAVHFRFSHTGIEGDEKATLQKLFRSHVHAMSNSSGQVRHTSPIHCLIWATQIDETLLRSHIADSAKPKEGAHCDACKLLFEVVFDHGKGLVEVTRNGWRRISAGEEEQEE